MPDQTEDFFIQDILLDDVLKKGQIMLNSRLTILRTKRRVPGVKIVNWDDKTLYFDNNYDYPKLADTFGWSKLSVQHQTLPGCDHHFTDGTIECSECGVQGYEFIKSATDYLNSHSGAVADDPGYF